MIWMYGGFITLVFVLLALDLGVFHRTAHVVKTRQAVGDDHIRYLSGLELFGEADAHDLPDDLHPNTAGYRRMGERFHALMLSGEGALV